MIDLWTWPLVVYISAVGLPSHGLGTLLAFIISFDSHQRDNKSKRSHVSAEVVVAFWWSWENSTTTFIGILPPDVLVAPGRSARCWEYPYQQVLITWWVEQYYVFNRFLFLPFRCLRMVWESTPPCCAGEDQISTSRDNNQGIGNHHRPEAKSPNIFRILIHSRNCGQVLRPQ